MVHSNQVVFAVPNPELEKIDEQAEKAGINRAEYVRQRFRAGELLWNAGKLNTKILKDLGSGKQLSQSLDRTEERSYTISETDHPISPSQNLKELILREIPDKSTGDGVSDEELEQLIFKSEEERKKAIEKAIEELYDDKITRRADGMLVRIGDEDA